MDGKKARNVLKYDQKYKLGLAIARDRDLAATMFAPELAERYTAELGFTVTAGNVKGVARAAGVATKIHVKPIPEDRLERLERLERVVGCLCDSMGLDFFVLAGSAPDVDRPRCYTIGSGRNGSRDDPHEGRLPLPLEM